MLHHASPDPHDEFVGARQGKVLTIDGGRSETISATGGVRRKEQKL